MDQAITWLESRQQTKADITKRQKPKSAKQSPNINLGHLSMTNRSGLRMNRGKLYSKWKSTIKQNVPKKKTFTSQKSLTPTVNKISKWPKQTPFYSPNQPQSKSSGLKRPTNLKINTFLQRMDLFGGSTIEKKASILKKNQTNDEAAQKSSNSRKAAQKGKLRNSKHSLTPVSQKKTETTTSKADITTELKNFANRKRTKNSFNDKTAKDDSSSIMFSKFLRSMEMGDNPANSTLSNKQAINTSWKVGRNVLEVVINGGAILIQILDSLENKRDIYDNVKDYVEISQNPFYMTLEDTLKAESNKEEFGDSLMTGLKLERWIILFFFFFSFNKTKMKKVKSLLLFLARKATENFYALIISLKSEPSIPRNLIEVIGEIENLLKKSGFDTEGIYLQRETIVKRNVAEIRNLLNISSAYATQEIKEKFKRSLDRQSTFTICTSTEDCLETFYPFLAEKKVISVEILDNSATDVKKSEIQIQSQTKISSTTIRSKKTSKESVKISTISHLETDKDFLSIVMKVESEAVRSEEEQLFFFQPDLENDENDPVPPFLADKKSEHRFTLVLDLDETLVHFEEVGDNGQFLVRPFAQQFLAEMGKVFEVVIFTAALQEVLSLAKLKYADWILERIDETKAISHRLYRQHTRPRNNVFIKDLSLIGRQLDSIIIIDNNAENFQLQQENGIFIKSWYGDQHDMALYKLTPILKQIALGQCSDVRVALRKLKEAMMRGLKRASSPLRDPSENKENRVVN